MPREQDLSERWRSRQWHRSWGGLRLHDAMAPHCVCVQYNYISLSAELQAEQHLRIQFGRPRDLLSVVEWDIHPQKERGLIPRVKLPMLLTNSMPLHVLDSVPRSCAAKSESPRGFASAVGHPRPIGRGCGIAAPDMGATCGYNGRQWGVHPQCSPIVILLQSLLNMLVLYLFSPIASPHQSPQWPGPSRQ
jgi:hypothetical protein